MTAEHQVRDAIKPPATGTRSLLGCGEDNEGDESGVGRQHPRRPLKMGRWQPLLGSGDVWVTACPILLFFSPNCSLHPWCWRHIKGIETQKHWLCYSPWWRHCSSAAWPVCPWGTQCHWSTALPARECEQELSQQPPQKAAPAAGVPAPVIKTSSKCRFSTACNFVWVFICLDGVFQLKASRRAS